MKRLTDPAIPLMLWSALNGFTNGSRRSGRTTRMLAAVKSGDVVVSGSGAQAEFLKRQLQQMYENGIAAMPQNVKFLAVPADVRSLEQFCHGIRGREFDHPMFIVHFDHLWLESWYERQLKESQDLLDGVVSTIYYHRPEPK